MLIIRASFHDLKPQIVAIIHIVDGVFVEEGCETTVLTSCWREYGEGSLHPYGYAADFDSEQMPKDWNDTKWLRVRAKIQERVGDEYDILVHGPPAHAHAEWDPRKKPISAVAV